MRKRVKNQKYLIIISVLFLLGIGYAALSSNLGIRASGSYKANSWDVYFDNIVDNSSYSEVIIPATISEDKMGISFQANLDEFDDKYIFYVDVVNNGSINTMLDTLEVNGLSEEAKNLIDVKVTYKDGIEVSRYDLLKENSRDTLKVEYSYKEDVEITDLPELGGSTGLTITINYLLADKNAKEREYGDGDINAPTITASEFSKKGNNGWLKALQLRYEILDKDAIKSVKYCVANNVCTPDTEVELQDNEFFYDFEKSSESQLLCVEAVDIFGNTSRECSDEYLVDGDIPVISSFSASANLKNINVEINGVDDDSGITKYYFSKNNGSTYVSSNNPNYTFTNLDDGSYEIVAYAEDRAGNISVLQKTTVSVAYYTYYAILYTDGTLALNSTGNIDATKTVSRNYGKITNGISYPWNANITQITKVIIEDVIRPKETTYWFHGATNLTEVVNGSNLDTSSTVSMFRMFSYCSNLTTIDVSKWDTSKVKSIDYMFAVNRSLTALDVSNWNLSSLTSMAHTFEEVAKVTILDVSKWNVSNVTNMDTTFCGMDNLQTLNVTNWDVSNVVTMRFMFYCDYKLNSLDFSKWNTGKVQDFENMLAYTASSATSKIYYYGPNSRDIYTNRSSANANNITLRYKSS